MKTTDTAYIFSKLNEEALALAKSIPRPARIQFTNIDADSIWNHPLTPACESLGYALIPKSLIRQLAETSGPKKVFLIDRDDGENLRSAMEINDAYAADENCEVYCFCAAAESECIIDSLNIRNYARCIRPMKLRRVLPIRNEVYHYLGTHSPFDAAHRIRGERWINIVIAGLNQYGLEMFRALLWFCQMEGYFLRIDVFDASPDIEDVVGGICPGILSRNAKPRIGEDYYEIHFHPNANYASRSFFDRLSELPAASWVIADTGSDRANFDLAMKLRRHYSGLKIDGGRLPDHLPETEQTPKLIAVIRDDRLFELIRDNRLRNFRGQCYQIEGLGQYSAAYSCRHILDNPLEKQALEAHSRMFPAEEFEMYEYFRRSSVASLLHLPHRDRLLDAGESAAITEHRRWCAYMRSTEGYTYGVARDDLAGRHPSLTAFDNLSRAEKRKDELMSG